MHDLGGDFVFALARHAGAHGAHVRPRRDARGLAHGVDFGAALEQAHVVQHVVERDDFLRRVPAIARLGAQAIHPADHALVELRVRAHRVEHLGAVLEQPRQDLVDVGDRKRVVGAEVAHRAPGTGASAIPGLARRIAIAHEQDVFALRAVRAPAPPRTRAPRIR